ncbi:MAG: hypothetical protein ACRD2W_08630 [Acidimicrobiales bacterium]
MIARRIGRLTGVVVLLAGAMYFLVYLWRWEWNRAVVAGIIFLAAEIGLSTVAVLDRIRGLGAPDGSGRPDPDVLATIRSTAPPPRDHFAWLSPGTGRMGVFVPVLMGMGVVVSALAWLVERLSRATAGSALERGLAARLAPLSWPQGGLIRPIEHDASDLLSGPVRR